MGYTPSFTPEYEGGWEDLPLETTPITADALNNYDEAVENIENYLASDESQANLADAYDETATYEAGDYVIYGGDLYKCLEDIDEPEEWDSTKWESCLITDEMATSGGTTVIANPSGTATDTLNKLQVENTIYSVEGGGGNANIWTGTQAELEEVFDELEEGTQINITDDEQEVVEGGTIYSEDEQVIGLWIDNKPLYQRTLVIDNVTQAQNTTVDLATLSDIDHIQVIGAAGLESGIVYIIPEFSDRIQFNVSTGKLQSTVPTNAGWSNATLTITIQYTKTTDAPIDAVVGKKTMYIASSDCYSTEEKEVGCAPNGKPLYQKTIDFGALPNSTTKSVAHGISNLDEIANVYGVAKSQYNQIPIPWANNTNTTYDITMYVDDTNVVVMTSIDRSGYTSSTITVQYTKTTDTAGSGQYTPASGKAVHYSTDEQVIGTWIDGSTVYRKVITLTTSLLVSYNSWTSTGITIANTDKVISCSTISISKVFSMMIAYFDNNELKVQTPRNGTTEEINTIILEYTKTS